MHLWCVCRNADRRLWYGNPSIFIPTIEELEDVPEIMETLLLEHGFAFAPPYNTTRVRKLHMNISKVHRDLLSSTTYNRLHMLP